MQAWDESMGMDARRPVQYADYSLNDGKILDDAMTTVRAVAELVAIAGLKG
ncbi:MAG: hypothetical protein HOI09_05245 [Porticoccaceae bacterium]|nr:hypothetical protein [Porticoccaceae bacterium]